MSSTSPAPTTTPSDFPTASPTPTQGGSGSPPSSALYLLTFLATLFVLLFISCAIVLRSFFIRRRFRRQVQAQIAAGTLPPQAAQRKRRDFGEKPRIWDVKLVPAPDGSWEHISPMAAKLLGNPNEPPEAPPQPSSSLWSTSLFRSFCRSRRPPETHPQPASRLEPGAGLVPLQAERAQVCVLVAMPQAPTARDALIPDVCIGVSEIPLKTE